ncbi:Protein of uncharacterised function (DUF2645) [Yersinia nurmii]|uniref:Protein of uncharacterized function (DUF2645) n=1 Tax=Yersinia nurmii TaxID=685706 RepID=A0ABM9S1M6_9GAMM|nr:Protein of uncharacterised function (DUF2645) [Yersinia nurmii]
MNSFNLVCKLLKPLLPLYYIGCVFAIFLLSFLDSDSMSGNDATLSLCGTITDANGESIRDFAIPFTFILMFPLIIHLIISLKNKKYVPPILAVLLIIYWWWSFFGQYLSC